METMDAVEAAASMALMQSLLRCLVQTDVLSKANFEQLISEAAGFCDLATEIDGDTATGAATLIRGLPEALHMERKPH